MNIKLYYLYLVLPVLQKILIIIEKKIVCTRICVNNSDCALYIKITRNIKTYPLHKFKTCVKELIKKVRMPHIPNIKTGLFSTYTV